MAETTPGGVYVVNGQRVNAEGRPLPEPPKPEPKPEPEKPRRGTR